VQNPITLRLLGVGASGLRDLNDFSHGCFSVMSGDAKIARARKSRASNGYSLSQESA
jgi:hypothetical protein